ncbi:hypothetical protein PFNF135_00105 [Plasmodium falciparum NF135/5.C10]|uniref:Uncharacterized protein n=1 Tax=Plasmodium falciparum NF135/5.C10 TaxID=1036726 RepID=W4IQ91_PLAFA|nr:hypothetical protein PFNF135_00105 [Plasmodium falciparum NF135/5.C10]
MNSDDSILFNISNKNFYNFHLLFKKDEKLKKEFFLQNRISEKTLLLNLYVDYSSMEDTSFFRINNTNFYNYYFDDYFYFFIKSCYDLDLYIKIQRKNIFLTDEKYFEFLKIHIMNKSTKNKNVPFYLCNNSVEQNNNLIQVLQKCFKHFNLYNGNSSRYI